MTLRFAEANPHFIARDAAQVAEAAGVAAPGNQNHGRAEILATSWRGGCPKAPSCAGRRVAEATRARRAGVARSRPQVNLGPRRRRSALEGWRLGWMPFPPSAFGAAPAEQPTSGRCSVDESVATHRRCQRRVARSSHGLCSPSRSFHHPLPAPGWGKPVTRGWWASAEGVVASHEIPGRRHPSVGLPRVVWPKPGVVRPIGGPKPIPAADPFQVGCGDPERGPTVPTAEAGTTGESVPSKSVRKVESRGAGSAMLPACARGRRGWPRRAPR